MRRGGWEGKDEETKVEEEDNDFQTQHIDSCVGPQTAGGAEMMTMVPPLLSTVTSLPFSTKSSRTPSMERKYYHHLFTTMGVLKCIDYRLVGNIKVFPVSSHSKPTTWKSKTI